MGLPFFKPFPAPPATFHAEQLPLEHASIISRLTFQWITPLMKVGYSRPVQADDLWSLPPALQCQNIAQAVKARLATKPIEAHHTLKYRSHAEKRDPASLRNSQASPRAPLAKPGISLIKAMYLTVWRKWWFAVVLKGLGASLQITAPLITKQLIGQVSIAHAYQVATSKDGLEAPRGVGYGIALAAGLFGMEIVASLCVYQALQLGSVIGFMMRSASIDLISRKSFRIASQSRLEFTSGKLTTMVSADASYLDFSAPMTLDLAVQPVQILVGIALLIHNLGYSALVGLAVLCLAGPLQAFMFKQMVKARQSQLIHIDARVRMLSEVISGIRMVKLYAYEALFEARVSKLRKQELRELRSNGINRATMNATMIFIPTLAAVLTFITYGLSGHSLDPATVFSGLQFFNILKVPISFLPMCFTAVSDAVVAIRRIQALLAAEEVAALNTQPQAKMAIDMSGSFGFDSSDNSNEQADPRVLATPPKPFSLRDICLSAPPGSLVCVVGRIGTGKTALMSALLNELRRESGQTTFGGDLSYVPQQPWVQSGTIRDNITFSSSPDRIDFRHLRRVTEACGLSRDIATMPRGISTPVGEKGSNLSGGQKQRLGLARAAYDSRSSIVLLDDPLSAVDANVASHILENCILRGPLARKTRILATQHLDVLHRADWILVLDREGDVGRIVQQGTYEFLRNSSGILRSLLTEYATENHSSASPEKHSLAASRPSTAASTLVDSLSTGSHMLSSDLTEERETGAISWQVYRDYGNAMGSAFWPWLFGTMLILTQLSNIGNALFLGFWSNNTFKGFTLTDYMAIYAGLGVGIAVFTWSASFTMFLAGMQASYTIFERAWSAVLRSPIRWHDETPSGRIISRLSKDVEMLDDRLASAWEMLLTNSLAVLGTFGLILYVYPYLGPVFIPLAFVLYVCASFYRQTSREVKRVNSIARSEIYSCFGEQLSGLSVIRAFGKEKLFEERMQNAINSECQAYIVTITIQRWLGIRLDLFSNVLVLLVAIVGLLSRKTVDPAKFGVVLTYTMSAASLFSNLVTLYAQVEQEMNNAERVLHYTKLPTEPTKGSLHTPQSWPEHGTVHFDNVQLRYRPDLPLVLKGLTFQVKAGEKVGIIGRTGAGKSSIAQALFRTVDITEGCIRVDGCDIAKLGLQELRTKLSIIPQDAFLFEGTVRYNIDPGNERTDQELNEILELIHSDPAASKALQAKLQLDSIVSAEGSNFSAGERQLLALVRALARDCKILVLDEATSSVDPETDSMIQRIIQKRLTNVTLLSIAHRLQTVAYYDRILVLDEGRIAEYNSPLVLFDRSDSIFRSLCDRVGLKRQDLLRIKHDAVYAAAIARDRSSLLYHYTIADAWATMRHSAYSSPPTSSPPSSFPPTSSAPTSSFGFEHR